MEGMIVAEVLMSSSNIFHAWLLLGSGEEAVFLGGVDIYVKSGHEVAPYFNIPMPGSTDKW
jgi:hypothetical protein